MRGVFLEAQEADLKQAQLLYCASWSLPKNNLQYARKISEETMMEGGETFINVTSNLDEGLWRRSTKDDVCRSDDF